MLYIGDKHFHVEGDGVDDVVNDKVYASKANNFPAEQLGFDFEGPEILLI